MYQVVRSPTRYTDGNTEAALSGFPLVHKGSPSLQVGWYLVCFHRETMWYMLSKPEPACKVLFKL